MKRQFIFLDNFGVIYEEIAPFVLRDVYGEELGAKIKNTYFPGLDLGERTLEEGLKEIVETYGGSFEDLQMRWKKQTKIRKGFAQFLANVPSSIHLVLVSNAPIGVIESMYEENGLASKFDGIFSSSVFHLGKPSKEFFDLVEERLGITKEDQILFADDNPKNLEAGKARGYETFLVENEGSLIDLEKEILRRA